MKKFIQLLCAPFLLISCSKSHQITLECSSDKVNPFLSGKEKIIVSIDNKTISTSNNFTYQYCGDSETYILGGQNIHGDRCSELIDDTRAPFMMNKKTSNLTFVWMKENDTGASGQYAFSGLCEIKTGEIKNRTVTIKNAPEMNDIKIQIIKSIK